MITVQSREDYLKQLRKFLPDNSVGCEIGVLHGDFSKMILDIVKPQYLMLIDPYYKSDNAYSNGLNTAYSTDSDFENLLKRFESEIENHQVHTIRRFSYEAVKFSIRETYDFIYIDSSHLYQDVKQDLNDWLPILKHDGIMCGHDMVDIEDFGVIRAVNEFMEEQGFEMILFNSNGGDFALKRKA